MCCMKMTVMTTKANSVATADDVVVCGASVDVLRHVKLSSWSVPLELNVTKLTFAPVTWSMIQFWNSDTRAKTSGIPDVAQPSPKLVMPAWIHFEPCLHCKGPPESPWKRIDYWWDAQNNLSEVASLRLAWHILTDNNILIAKIKFYGTKIDKERYKKNIFNYMREYTDFSSDILAV